MEELKQQQLLRYRQPSKFFNEVKSILEHYKLVIDGHVKVKTDDIWGGGYIWKERQTEVNHLLATLELTKNRAENEYKALFNDTVYEDSMLYTECLKFCHTAKRVIWQDWAYSANALIHKIEGVLNSLKYDDQMIYLNAKMMLMLEKQIQLQMPGNILLAQQLKDSQQENALLKQQLAQVTKLSDLHTQQIKELQQANAEMKENFKKISLDYAQLLEKAAGYKQEAESHRKTAAAYSPTFLRPKQVKPLFTGKIDRATKEALILETDHSPTICCPITKLPMTNPVLLIHDNHTYQKEAIEEWIQKGAGLTFKSPMTGNVFPKPENLSDILCENIIVRTLFSEYIAESPRDVNKDPSPERKNPNLNQINS